MKLKELMDISFYGSTDTNTGYGVHSKMLVDALKKQDVNVMIGDYIKSPSLAITMPEIWQSFSGNRNHPFIPFLIFEGTKMSEGWVYYCNQDYITHLFVPSKHVKDVAKNSGVTKPITIAPHGVNTELFNPSVKPDERIKGDYFKFFMLGGWGQGINDRKGFQYALKAFCEEFKKSEPVELHWKINMIYNPQLNINSELNKLNLGNDRPMIRMYTQQMNFVDIPKLYTSMDCFVAPSMAEAFNMGCTEAMSCGLPVITTNYSGMVDYVTEKEGWLIDVEKMIKSKGMPEHIYESAQWAVPSVKHLRKLMRYAYEHRDECKSKGKLSAEKIKKNYTWDKTAKIVKKTFQKYL